MDTPLYKFYENTIEAIIKVVLGSIKSEYAEVSKYENGKFGSTYVIRYSDSPHLNNLIAKCPILENFNDPQDARKKIEKSLYELENTFSLYSIPYVNQFHDVEIIHGWPFLIARLWEGTLLDLMGNPLAWSKEDIFSFLGAVDVHLV